MSKAYILSDRTGDCPDYSLVWADTVSGAKMMAGNTPSAMYQSDLSEVQWCALQARRAPGYDDCKSWPELDICVKLMRDDCWWFEIGDRCYTADNIDGFINAYKKGAKWR